MFVHGFSRTPADWKDNDTTKPDSYVKWINRDYRSPTGKLTKKRFVGWERGKDNDAIATDIKNRVNELYRLTGKTVDIITHSIGSLGARKFIKTNPNLRWKVGSVAALAGPNHGILTCLGGNVPDTACSQMKLFSEWLAALNQDDETPGAAIKYLTIALPSRSGFFSISCDLPVPSGLALADTTGPPNFVTDPQLPVPGGAVNVKLPDSDECMYKDTQINHLTMLRHEWLYKKVMRFLNGKAVGNG